MNTPAFTWLLICGLAIGLGMFLAGYAVRGLLDTGRRMRELRARMLGHGAVPGLFRTDGELRAWIREQIRARRL